MKATVTLSRFREALAVVGLAIRKGGPLPVLEQVRIEAAEDGGLVLTATDIESWASCGVACEVEKGGGLLAHHATLAALLAKMPDGTVRLSVDSRGLALRAGAASAKLSTMDMDSFPIPREQGDGPTWFVTGVQLATMAHRVPWAASDLDSRANIQGVCWRIKDGRSDVVATDGTVLALQGWPANGTDVDVLVPTDGLVAAAKLFGNVEPVAVTLAGGWLEFAAGGISYRTRLLSDVFPTYRQVIPRNNDRRVTTSRAALLSAVQYADVVSHQITHSVALDFKDGSVGVSAANNDGEGSTSVPCELAGEPVRLKVNAPRLTNALRRLSGDDVVMEIGPDLTPMILRPATIPDGEESLMLVVPMRDL